VSAVLEPIFRGIEKSLFRIQSRNALQTLFNPAAGLFHTFREALAQAQSTATPRFLVGKAKTLRSTFYRPPAFRTT